MTSIDPFAIPGMAGTPGNLFIDPQTGAGVYCVADPSSEASVYGVDAEGSGRSPRNLRATTLGDWLQQAQPRARVFSVSGKDRAADLLGGKGADAAYWFQPGAHPGFTTSRYYRDPLPQWVEGFCGLLRGSGLDLRWACNTRANTAHAAMLRLMREAGFA